MLNKVSDFIGQHQLLSRDGLHLVALSGGADSVALLLILQELGYRVEAVHCNFHLRGEESNRDEAFVKSLCKEKDVKLHLIHFDSIEYAKLHKVSIEMAARELRYTYFHRLCEDIGAETVCVAHHRDDAVETFLMNLLRGSGVHGLTGIRPRNGIIVRPLLCVSRQEIEAYLRKIGQTYVTDSTNLVDDVLRNKIRLRLIPLMKELNPKAVDNIFKTTGYLREAEIFVNQAIMDLQSEFIHFDKESDVQSVIMSELKQLTTMETFLHEWLSPYGFNASQTEQILSRLDAGSGKSFVSGSHELIIDRNQLLLCPLQAPLKTIKMPEPGNYRYTDNLLFKVEKCDNITISQSDDCATLDASKIEFPLTVRPVQNGDVFCPFGMQGHQLLSDFLTNSKISVLEKRRQLVLTDAKGDILWVIGRRTDNRYRVEKQTSSILRLTVVKTL